MINDSPAIFARGAPYPHVVALELLDPSTAEQIMQWFEHQAPWRLRVEDFYEQYELNLHQAMLPKPLQIILVDETIDRLTRIMLNPLTTESMVFVEANAHKLLPGQTIKIHNDYIEGAETHRILIQLNRNGSDDNGGLLMLFFGPDARDVARVIRPIHKSAAAFEISPVSFHAVSTILTGERYTLVYSFKYAA